ncbi:MAG: poly-beta-1,6-N-acetyl-D-glucosamine N-deacetylase PgaB, partial [Deltaproteobacteria bacterium]
FSRLIEDFPGSPYASLAQAELGKAYLFAGRYVEARDELRRFLVNYPEAPQASSAMHELSEAVEMIRARHPPAAPLLQEPGDGGFRVKSNRVRAVQVMFFEGSTLAEVAEEVKRLKEAGVDTLILRVFHNSADRYYRFARHTEKRGVYFKTSHAPVVDDILGDMARIAHAQGLQVFAWMTTRYADYGVEERRDLTCKGYDIESGKDRSCKGLDLFNEESVKRLEAIYSDLADHDIDGVLFQDDLVLRHNEGFGRYAQSLFRGETGLALEPGSLYIRGEGGSPAHYTKLFWEWASWKNRRLLEVAGRLREAVRKKRPSTKFAINLMYESVVKPSYSLAWLSQDIGAAKRSGFDYYSIMAYHRQMEDELGQTPEEIKAVIRKMIRDVVETVGDEGKALIKFQTVDWKTGGRLHDSEVLGIIREAEGAGGLSLDVVPYREDFPFSEVWPLAVSQLKTEVQEHADNRR